MSIDVDVLDPMPSLASDMLGVDAILPQPTLASDPLGPDALLPLPVLGSELLGVDAILPQPTLEALVEPAPVGEVMDVSVVAPRLELEADVTSGEISEVSVTAPMPTLEAVATQGIDIVLPMPTLEAEVLPGNVCNVSVIAPMATMEADAISGGFANVDVTAPTPTLEAEVLVGAIIDVDITLPAATLEAEAFNGNVCDVSATLPMPTMEAVAYGDITIIAELVAPLFQISADVTSAVPSTFRTWVLNMRNKGLSEYTNFPFNSFAEFNGQVLAASSDGIRALGTQSQDDTTAIAATVRDGAMDYGSPQLKRIPRIYMSHETTGDLNFRTVATDAGDYTYHLPWNGETGMQTRRVPIGRGPRARYWQFEVTNVDGADFSIASVIVHPEELKRRVI